MEEISGTSNVGIFGEDRNSGFTRLAVTPGYKLSEAASGCRCLQGIQMSFGNTYGFVILYLNGPKIANNLRYAFCSFESFEAFSEAGELFKKRCSTSADIGCARSPGTANGFMFTWVTPQSELTMLRRKIHTTNVNVHINHQNGTYPLSKVTTNKSSLFDKTQYQKLVQKSFHILPT